MKLKKEGKVQFKRNKKKKRKQKISETKNVQQRGKKRYHREKQR